MLPAGEAKARPTNIKTRIDCRVNIADEKRGLRDERGAFLSLLSSMLRFGRAVHSDVFQSSHPSRGHDNEIDRPRRVKFVSCKASPTRRKDWTSQTKHITLVKLWGARAAL